MTVKSHGMFDIEVDLNPFEEEFANEGKCSWLFDPSKIRDIFKEQLNKTDKQKDEDR